MPERQDFNRQDLIRINETAGLSLAVNQGDEYEFAELIAKDQLWACLVDGTTLDVDEARNYERNAIYAARLDHPHVPLHILGGFYIQSLNGREGWVTINRLFEKWLGGYTRQRDSDGKGLDDKLFSILNQLQDEKLLQRFHGSVRLHPDFQPEEDFPPVANDFEEITVSYLAKRPLGTIGSFCVYNYMRTEEGFALPSHAIEDIDPHKYWAGRYELRRMMVRGLVEETPNERWHVRLVRDPYASAGEEQEDLDSRIAQSRYRAYDINSPVMKERLGEKLHQAGLRGRDGLRKPKQRGRWKE